MPSRSLTVFMGLRCTSRATSTRPRARSGRRCRWPRKSAIRLARRYGLGYLAMISAYQGQLAEAEDLIRCATGGGRDLADGEHFVDVMVSLAAAIVLDMRGDAAAAAEAAEMAVGLARKGAGVLEVANALLARAEILGHLGEHATAAASRHEAAMLLAALHRCRHRRAAAHRATARRGVAVSARTPGVRAW